MSTTMFVLILFARVGPMGDDMLKLEQGADE